MQVFGSNTLQLFWTTAAHQVHHLRSHLSLSLSSDAGLGRRSQGLFTWVLYHLTGVQTSKGENPCWLQGREVLAITIDPL